MPLVLRLLKFVSDVVSTHYALRIDPLIVSHDPRISRIWSLIRPFLSDTLRRRMIVVPSDAEFMYSIAEYIGPHSVPLSLRRRSLRALLSSRPTRSQLLARGILLTAPGEGHEGEGDEDELRGESEAQQKAVAFALLQVRASGE